MRLLSHHSCVPVEEGQQAVMADGSLCPPLPRLAGQGGVRLPALLSRSPTNHDCLLCPPPSVGSVISCFVDAVLPVERAGESDRLVWVMRVSEGDRSMSQSSSPPRRLLCSVPPRARHASALAIDIHTYHRVLHNQSVNMHRHPSPSTTPASTSRSVGPRRITTPLHLLAAPSRLDARPPAFLVLGPAQDLALVDAPPTAQHADDASAAVARSSCSV